MMRIASGLLLPIFALAFGTTAMAQSVTVKTDDEWCDRDSRWHDDDDYDRHCEVREFRISDGRDVIRVDAEPNGGISVTGWSERDVLVRAKVVTNASTMSAAREMARDVDIHTGATIRADGPRHRKRHWYSVSYEIFAPRESSLDLETKNGGVSIENFGGRVRFKTLNGGVELADLSGDVIGRTTNGGLSIHLTGSEWEGQGLDVETINGGVEIQVPRDYSAELEMGTVNGHIEVNFPIMIEGRLNRRLKTTLGDGGKLIRAVTTNGGVVVTRG